MGFSKKTMAFLAAIMALGCLTVNCPAYAEESVGQTQSEQQTQGNQAQGDSKQDQTSATQGDERDQDVQSQGDQNQPERSVQDTGQSQADDGVAESEDFSNSQGSQSDESPKAAESESIDAESAETVEMAPSSSSTKLLQPGNRYYTNVSDTHEAGLVPGLYLVSAVSAGWSSHFSISDEKGYYSSIDDTYAVKQGAPQKIEVKDGHYVHIFAGSGLCASSWKLLKEYSRNAGNSVLYPGTERTLTSGTYSATLPESNAHGITAGNYLVKAVKESSWVTVKDSSGNTLFVHDAPYASTSIGGYDSLGWTEVKIPSNGSVEITGPIDGTATSTWVKLNAYQTPQLQRVAGGTRYEIMGKLVGTAFTGKADTVIVASGANYPDALAASALAGVKSAPIVLTDPNTLSDAAAQQLKRLRPSSIIIAGGSGAVSVNVAGSLRNYASKVSRVAGSTRYDTSYQLYLQGKGNWGSTAIVVTGANYADALSVSSYAYAAKAPVFLSDPNGGLTSAQKNVLKSFKQVIVVGGTGVVPSWVVQGLPGLSRISGSDRYDTSKKVAEWAHKNGLGMDGAVFATGANFADALAAGPLAGRNRGMMLLVDSPSCSTVLYSAGFKGKVSKVWVAGGTSAVSTQTADAIADKLGMRRP